MTAQSGSLSISMRQCTLTDKSGFCCVSYRLHPTQVKAARGFLGWTQEDLSEESGVSLTAIRSFEAGSSPRTSTMNQIRRTLEKFGVEFTDDDGIRPRKENVKILQGPDSCDRLFEDMKQVAEETGTEIFAFLRTYNLRTQPCGTNSQEQL